MKQSAKVATTVSAHELSESETAQHRLRLDADEAELEESVIRCKIRKGESADREMDCQQLTLRAHVRAT